MLGWPQCGVHQVARSLGDAKLSLLAAAVPESDADVRDAVPIGSAVRAPPPAPQGEPRFSSAQAPPATGPREHM
jgi:hypothetical protein